MTNPYIVGPPVRGRAFCGRETITAAILNSPHPALRVLGIRHIGKTSLLYCLMETSPALYLDFQAATGDPARLAGRVRQQLRRGRGRFPWLPTDDEEDDPIALLEKATVRQSVSVCPCCCWATRPKTWPNSTTPF